MPMHGKKKSKMMAKGGYGTPTKKMKMKAGGAVKKMVVGKPKATKMMGGGYSMKKKK